MFQPSLEGSRCYSRSILVDFGFFIEDGQLYCAWRTWVFAMKWRLRKKWRPLWWWCRVAHELFVSELFYTNSSRLLVLHYHRMTKAFEFMSDSIIFPVASVCIVSKKGNTSYWVPILANRNIVEHYFENVVDVPHMKNLGENISLLSCWRHSPSVRMYSALKLFPKPLFPIPSTFFSLSDVFGLIQPFTALQNLCWLEIYMVIYALGSVTSKE